MHALSTLTLLSAPIYRLIPTIQTHSVRQLLHCLYWSQTYSYPSFSFLLTLSGCASRPQLSHWTLSVLPFSPSPVAASSLPPSPYSLALSLLLSGAGCLWGTVPSVFCFSGSCPAFPWRFALTSSGLHFLALSMLSCFWSLLTLPLRGPFCCSGCVVGVGCASVVVLFTSPLFCLTRLPVGAISLLGFCSWL